MNPVFLKLVKIKNYRLFADKIAVDLKVPDGTTQGSGLTILIGENGCGKTSVLEALELLTKNLFSIRNKISVSDFSDITKKIEITGEAQRNFGVKRLWGNTEYQSEGFYFYANIRGRDESARLLDPIVVDNEFIQHGSTPTLQSVEKRLSATGPYGNERVPLRIHYFDKNRSRHLITGNYQTQLDTVMADLNFQFLKWLLGKTDDEKTEIAQKATESFNKIHKNANDKIIAQAFNEVKTLVGDQNFRIDFGNLTEPYTTANIFVRDDNSLKQIPLNKLGSGIEMLCSLVFLETIYKTTSANALYCIDEPEIHLHPQLQQKLLAYLLELSKTRQIVISTHSPIFFNADLLPNTTKLSVVGNTPKQFNVSSQTSNKISENRNFFDRHKNLMFASRAIFVEGPDDLERFSMFANQNGLGELVEHFYLMNGKDSVRMYEALCEDLGISFTAILDRDFSYNTSIWNRQRAQRFLQRVQRDWANFDLNAFNAANNNPTDITEKSGNDKPTTVTMNGTDIIKAHKGNLYILKNGEVTDYLTKQGVAVNDESKTEIIAILKQIKTDLSI